MRCPHCGYSDSKVTDSREAEEGIRRRRECQRCKVRFTTYERVQSAALLVSKRDNRREEFNREKLLAGLRLACAKRPVDSRTIEKLVEDIEAELQHLGRAEVPTTVLGEMVMERLKNLDRVAYIRYASVYREFNDIESFEQAVKDLRDDNPQLPLPQMGSVNGRQPAPSRPSPPASPHSTNERPRRRNLRLLAQSRPRQAGARRNTADGQPS
ncbi:MAG: transcriptional repressor NrdR [Dehalococcoidia bacterium]|nr:transcriptional repressor NrdR [Dehalococcoidia bacterium]MSQ16917.1 transcriptional repressor NrdR [Dehalococcoidia bacterium]